MKKLRSGYTTGACAAAAAKGAAICLLSGAPVGEVEIPFPDGHRVAFALYRCGFCEEDRGCCQAAVVKDAGDDPDVTNGAVIAATVRLNTAAGSGERELILIRGGEGVGIVTKPGLSVPIGEPAINPIPLKMIREAVAEVMQCYHCGPSLQLLVEISVPGGRKLADKTLNERLGIIGGISILGTTGIVRPVSAEAWTATITTAMDVALAGGNREIVLSTGRTSETALQEASGFRPESFVMMGDYLEFALKEAGKYPFTRLHMAAMWAKLLKAALRIPQTHVRFGALEIEQAIALISAQIPGHDFSYLAGANTAREIYERLLEQNDEAAVELVCRAAKNYHQELSGKPVTVYLVHHTGRIMLKVE